MMSKLVKKVTLLWALPASGKSYYANHYNDNRRKNDSESAHTINMDNIKNGDWESLIRDIGYVFSSHNHVILDGLIVTNSTAENIINKIKDKFNHYDISFEIICWKPDIQACLWNDENRRTIDSKITIKNMKVEEPSKELLSKFNINLIKKEVVAKSSLDHWISKNGIHVDEKYKMTSDTWSLGGTSGNCWDSEVGTISPGEPLTCFKEFDDLIANVCPDIGFMAYKQIYNHCVDSDTTSCGDYYGGCIKYAFFTCDVKKLYEMLIEKKIIVEDSFCRII